MKLYLLFIPAFLLLIASCKKSELSPANNIIVDNPGNTLQIASTITNALIIDKSKDLIKIYMRTGRDSNRWILLNYKREILLDLPDDHIPPAGIKSAASSYNIWHFKQATEAYRTGIYSFTTSPALLCQNAEWELAVLKSGSDDFVGGAIHGWEIKNDFALKVDNTYPRETSSFKRECNQINIIQSSKLYIRNTADELADVVKTYSIKKDSVLIKVDIRWLRNAALSNLKFGMLPASRNTKGKQITSFGTKTANGVVSKVVDISKPIFEPSNVFTTFSPTTTKIKIWGDDFVASVEKEQKPVLPNSRMTLSASSSYNKIYPDFSGVTNVARGQKFSMTAKYYLGLKK